jgi:hypothetical protein
MNEASFCDIASRAAKIAADISADTAGDVVAVNISRNDQRASLLIDERAMSAMYPGAKYRMDPDGKGSRAKVEHPTEWGAVELVSVRLNYNKPEKGGKAGTI